MLRYCKDVAKKEQKVDYETEDKQMMLDTKIEWR